MSRRSSTIISLDSLSRRCYTAIGHRFCRRTRANRLWASPARYGAPRSDLTSAHATQTGCGDPDDRSDWVAVPVPDTASVLALDREGDLGVLTPQRPVDEPHIGQPECAHVRFEDSVNRRVGLADYSRSCATTATKGCQSNKGQAQ